MMLVSSYKFVIPLTVKSVGKLNYLTVTCLDIANSVSVVSHYMFAPTVDHWVDVEHILCYLKGVSGRGILYSYHGHNRIK